MRFSGTENFFRKDIEPIPTLDIILFILALISLGLNGLLLFFTIKKEQVRHALDIIYLLIIAALDIACSLLVIASQIWKWSTNYTIVKDNSLWCHISSILGWSITASVLVMMSLLSLVRYLIIVRGYRLNRTRWTIIAFALVGFIFGLFILKDIASKPYAFPSGMICASFWEGSEHMVMALFFLMLLILIPPLFIILFCCSSVANHYARLVAQFGPSKNSRRLTRRILGFYIIIFAYVITTIPEYLQAFISLWTGLKVVSWIDGLVKILIFSVCLVNAIFALGFHDELNRDLMTFLDRFV